MKYGYIEKTMNMNPKISVIVPVYNAAKYLDECIISIINQTINDIEIIIVDDCSTDGSKDIILKYIHDPRIKFLAIEKNSGVSYARNTGLKCAKGEYIGFVDSDDFISNDMFEKMLKSNSDIISCGYKKCDDEGNVISNHPFPLKSLKSHEEICKALSTAHETRFIWFACRNLYKRELITENKIQFNEKLKIGEDSLFNMYSFYYANSVSVINESLYYYRSNPNSITSKKGKYYLEDSLALLYNEKMSFYNKFGFNEEALKGLYRYTVTHQLPMLLVNSLYCKNNIKHVFLLPMLKISLKNMPVFNPKLPIGIQVLILLSKLKQYWMIRLLHFFLIKIR